MWQLRWIHFVRIAGAVLLLEQLVEVLFLGIKLAENPALVIAALGALGLPEPKGRE